jgi:hypothetical protein
MSFDTFNGSLVEHCLVYVAGLELVTNSNIEGTRRAKSSNKCTLMVTGLTGDMHRSDRCRPSVAVGRVTRHLCPGDPVRLCVLQVDPTPIAGWLGSEPLFKKKGWFDVNGNERLDTSQLINHLCVVTKFVMSLTQFLIKCFVREIKLSLALFKGEVITTLESLVGLTISSSDLVVLLFCASLSKLLICITPKRTSKS